MASKSFGTGTNTTKYLPNVDRLDRPSTVNANLPSTYASLSIYNRPGFKADLYGITSAGSANAALIAAALRRAEEERARLELLRRQREEALRAAQAQQRDQNAPTSPAVVEGQSFYERFKALEQARTMGAEGTFFKSADEVFRTTDREGNVRVTSFDPALGEDQRPAWQRARFGQPESVNLNPNAGSQVTDPLRQSRPWQTDTGDVAIAVGEEPYSTSDSRFRPFVAQTLEQRKQRLEELYEAFPYLRDETGDLSSSSIPDSYDIDNVIRSAEDRAISQEDFAKGNQAAYLNRDLAAEYRRKQIGIWGQPREIYYESPADYVTRVVNGETVYFDTKTGRRLNQEELTQREFLREEFGYFGEPGVGAEGPGGKNIQYLGLYPGEVPIRPIPEPPPLDAPYSEQVAYRKALNNVFADPLYKPDAPFRELSFMDPKKRAQFQRQLVKAGLYEADEVYTPGIITDREIEIMTGLMGTANKNGLTWQDILDVEIIEGQKAAAAAAASYGGGGGGGGGTNVYTQIQYTQTSIAAARSLMVNVLQEALGRAPTDEEVERFLLLLNKREAKSPTKTVTRTTTSGDSTRAVSRTTPSTVDAQALAEEFAQGIGGGAEFEAKSDYDYLSGLFDSLGAPGV
jgi:hypothetical protein